MSSEQLAEHLDAGDLAYHRYLLAEQQRLVTAFSAWQLYVSLKYRVSPQDAVREDGAIFRNLRSTAQEGPNAAAEVVDAAVITYN